MHRVKAAVKWTSYAAAKTALGGLLVPYFRLSVRGREKIPRDGGLVFAANHFSFADPPLLGIAMPRRIWFVMSGEMFRKATFYLFSRLMDVIPVAAGQPFQTAAMRKILRVLKDGHCVGIFPEGQRSRTGQLLPAQRGVGVFAQRAGVPVVPVAIAGTREAFPAGVWFPRPRKVRVFVGDPIPPFAGGTPDLLAEKVRGAIAALLQEHGCGDYVGEE